MAGIGSKTHDVEDSFQKRRRLIYWCRGNSQSSFTDVRENPGQLSLHAVLIFKHEETVAGGRLIRIRCTLSLKNSTKLFVRSRSFSCDDNFLSAFRFDIFPVDKNSTRWLLAFSSITLAWKCILESCISLLTRAPDEPRNQDSKRYWRFYAMSGER